MNFRNRIRIFFGFPPIFHISEKRKREIISAIKKAGHGGLVMLMSKEEIFWIGSEDYQKKVTPEGTKE